MKTFIKNRKGQNVCVVVEAQENPRGLVFVMHGLSGSMNQPHILTFADTFKKKGFSVVRFDTTNTLGESDGNLEDATLTNYYEDLQDVIVWAKTQEFYQEPFVLVGHSLGAISCALHAQAHPEQVKALAPISVVVSGALSEETEEMKKVIENWERTGIREWKSTTKPGLVKRIKWNHMVDRRKYDLLPDANKLTMPALMIVGSEDTSTPVYQQEILFNALPGKKEMHIIDGAPHTFADPQHLSEIKQIFEKWIDAYL